MELVDRTGGSVVTAAALPRIGSAAIVIDHEDRVLLGRRRKEPNFGRWVLPGGKIEPFESIEDAVRREVAEETGLDVEVTGQLGAFEIIDEERQEHRVIIFSTARPTGGRMQPASDLSQLAFVSRRELAAMDITEIVRKVLTKAGLLLPARSLMISHH